MPQAHAFRSIQVRMMESRGTLTRGEFKKYGPVTILKSPAGYYLGTNYHAEGGAIHPGSRDTKYFGSTEEASVAMENYKDIVTYMVKARIALESGDQGEWESIMDTVDKIINEIGLRLEP